MLEPHPGSSLTVPQYPRDWEMKWGKSYHPEGLRSSAVLMGQEMQVVFQGPRGFSHVFLKPKEKSAKGASTKLD